jgi:hypothetical protein
LRHSDIAWTQRHWRAQRYVGTTNNGIHFHVR